MSTVIYGAVCLTETGPETARDLRDYWQGLSTLHGVSIHVGRPVDEYLQHDIAALWANASWIRFQISADAALTEANTLLIAAANAAGAVLSKGLPGITRENIWCRTPQWRCLDFMFWHEALVQAYLVVEDTSGDAAVVEEMRQAPLTEVLRELWLSYVCSTSEDAVIYHIDLRQLPR